jgi:hypothetical protein
MKLTDLTKEEAFERCDALNIVCGHLFSFSVYEMVGTGRFNVVGRCLKEFPDEIPDGQRLH